MKDKHSLDASELRQLEAEADAYELDAKVARDRLAAAAPDLLAALRECAEYMPCGEPSRGNGSIEPEGWAEVIERARAAIAKAEGGAE